MPSLKLARGAKYPDERIAIMRKGGHVRLRDYLQTFPPPVVTLGLAWDVTKGVNIDLDASCIMLDENLECLDIVFFGKLQSSDGSVRHGGDEREGDEKGDDEKVYFSLAALHPSVKYLCVVVNSYSGQELDDVQRASCRLYATEGQTAAMPVWELEQRGAQAARYPAQQKELVQFKLSDAEFLNGFCALCVGYLYKESVTQEWCFGIMAEAAHGRTAQDNVDEFQRHLRAHPPQPLGAQRDPPRGDNLVFNTVDGKGALAGKQLRLATVRELLADDVKRWNMWQRHFQAADANMDGVLDRAEARQATRLIVQELFSTGDAWAPRPEALDAAFARCDCNRDGVLTNAEFSSFVEELLRGIERHTANAAGVQEI